MHKLISHMGLGRFMIQKDILNYTKLKTMDTEIYMK